MPYISVLQKYTQFNGRAARREFWGFTIVQLILLAIAVVVDELLFPEQSEWRGGPITAMFLVLTIMPWVCVWARRLQDRHDSGFLQLLVWGTAGGVYRPRPRVEHSVRAIDRSAGVVWHHSGGPAVLVRHARRP